MLAGNNFLFVVQSPSHDSLWPHGLQHARLPCPSPTPGACSYSCPLNGRCHSTISSSVVPFSSCLQSVSASVPPMNIQDWFPLGLTGLISLQSKEFSRVFSNTTVQKHQFFCAQLSLWSNSQHPYMTTEKTIALTRWNFVDKVMSLVFSMLFTLVKAFLPWSKCLLISWLQSSSAVISEAPKIKSVTVSIVSPSLCHEVMGLDATILVFRMLSFEPAFPLSVIFQYKTKS